MIVAIGLLAADAEPADARGGGWLAGAIIGGIVAGSLYHHY
jgi:hypothetical protein